MDLAAGHVTAVETLGEGPGIRVWNLGTGRGYSVLEVVRAFEKASGRSDPLPDRPPAPGRHRAVLRGPVEGRAPSWAGKRCAAWTEMCADSWRWQESNPNGFDDAD